MNSVLDKVDRFVVKSVSSRIHSNHRVIEYADPLRPGYAYSVNIFSLNFNHISSPILLCAHDKCTEDEK